MKVIVNFALSADGKIGTHAGGASKFTSRKDLERLWEIRNQADAVMVGRGTLEADHMSMTIPEDVLEGEQPLRIIVSRQGVVNPDHPVFHKPGGAIHLLCTGDAPATAPNGVTVHQCALEDFLTHCQSDLGVETLLCEGGGQLARALAELDLLDEIHLTIAGHTLIGGKSAPGILGTLSSHLPASRTYQLDYCEPLENGECFLSYKRA